VQVDRAWFQRLKPKYDEQLSTLAFNFNLRRYTSELRDALGVPAEQHAAALLAARSANKDVVRELAAHLTDAVEASGGGDDGDGDEDEDEDEDLAAAVRLAAERHALLPLVSVQPGGQCWPRHPTHEEPSTLELSGTYDVASAIRQALCLGHAIFAPIHRRRAHRRPPRRSPRGPTSSQA